MSRRLVLVVLVLFAVPDAKLRGASPSQSIVDLGTLGGRDSWAFDVNDHGLVVGSSDIPSSSCFLCEHAFLWTAAGGMVDLGTVGGSSSRAFSVNNSGLVVGQTDLAGGGRHAFSWTAAGGMVDLGTLGGTYSAAFGVNENGSVVGESSTGVGTTIHAFFWTAAGGMIDLGTLGGTRSWASGVNGSGLVVGSSYIERKHGDSRVLLDCRRRHGRFGHSRRQ